MQQTIAEEAVKVEALRQQIRSRSHFDREQRREMLAALKETQQQLKDAQSLEQATAVLTRGEKKFESLTSAEAEAQTEGLRQAGQRLAQNEGSPLQSFGQNLADGYFLSRCWKTCVIWMSINYRPLKRRHWPINWNKPLSPCNPAIPN